LGKAYPSNKCAHGVLSTMRKINDVEEAKNNGQPQTQNSIKRTVNQPHQELCN